ncbi:hypothetical protein RF55_3653 [Lasius niger]|uniref:THAP-type domain-containing protein n=1 Tax=Lasius niger TaxID=67767 RepID=A0A0J7NUN6_LASNI|nr:hypothetical protein RF55_3653 [Lasius niger]
MTRVCICCKYRVIQTHVASDISLYGLPKNDELLKKWLLAIGETGRKICESSRICSRHFKEDDFRYSIVGGKRFLKRDAIPSLHLNEEFKDDRLSDSGSMMEPMESKSLNIAISQVDARKDNQMSRIIGTKVQTTAEDTCESTEFVAHECYDKTQVPERISASLDSSLNEPKKGKRYLYDVRWEEISTSPVQAKIYWEVAIKKITRQKVILRSLRQKVKRLKKTILELRTRVKNVASSDSQ